MKNNVILLIFLSLFSFAACSQKNPPDIVKKEFSQKFNAASSVKWGSEKANEWEAEFKMNGKEMSACFDNAGKWLETESEVSAKDLPDAVANTLKNEFSGFKTGEISTIENPEMKGFELALKNEKTKMTVIIGTDGTVMKKESGKEAVSEENEKNENESDEAGEKKAVMAPEKILTAFNQKFPGASSVEWGSEKASEWEAEFKMEGKKISACFDTAAVWIDTETQITEKDLPAEVAGTINTEFKGYKKRLIEIYESPEIKGFELLLKKGEKAVEVIISKEGKILKQSDVSEEED